MKRTILVVAVLLACAGSAAWAQVNLTASIAQLPDLAESPEKGVFVELVKAIDEVYTEGEITIQVYPFARSVQNVMRGTADFHIPSFVNPVIPESQLPHARVPEPTGKVTLVIYSNAYKPLTKADIDAAVARGGKFPYVIEVGSGMEVMFPFPTQGSNSIEQSMRKVNAGRIDAYLWPPEGDVIVRDFRLGRIHREVFSDFDDVILVAKTPRGQQTARILDAALKELRRQSKLKQYHDPVHMKYEAWQPHEMGW